MLGLAPVSLAAYLVLLPVVTLVIVNRRDMVRPCVASALGSRTGRTRANIA